MKHLLILILISLIVFSLTIGLTNQKPKDNPNMVFRITSDKSDESISFKAAYIFGVEKPELNIADMSTPITIYGYSEEKFVTAIFQKTRGSGHLVIELLSPEDLKEKIDEEVSEEEEHESRLYMGGTGSLIIFTTNISNHPATHSVYVRDY